MPKWYNDMTAEERVNYHLESSSFGLTSREFTLDGYFPTFEQQVQTAEHLLRKNIQAIEDEFNPPEPQRSYYAEYCQAVALGFYPND